MGCVRLNQSNKNVLDLTVHPAMVLPYPIFHKSTPCTVASRPMKPKVMDGGGGVVAHVILVFGLGGLDFGLVLMNMIT